MSAPSSLAKTALLASLLSVSLVFAADADGTRNGFKPIPGGKELTDCSNMFMKLGHTVDQPGDYCAEGCRGGIFGYLYRSPDNPAVAKLEMYDCGTGTCQNWPGEPGRVICNP